MSAMAAVDINRPTAVKARLEAFAAEVLGAAMNRPPCRCKTGRSICGAARGRAAPVARAASRAPGPSGRLSVAAAILSRQPLGFRPGDTRGGRARGDQDRSRGVGLRRHRPSQGRQGLAGGQASVLGHPGPDRQLPDWRQSSRGGAQGNGSAGVVALSARGVVWRYESVERGPRSPSRSPLPPSPSWAPS